MRTTVTTIEAFGATSLVQTGSNYFLNPTAGGSGPEVMLHGAPLAAGQFTGWSPMAAEKTSNGFVFAMHSGGSDQFIIWTLDNNANYVTNTAPMSGSSTALKSYEASFQQDLNGDGVISPASAAPAAPADNVAHDTSTHDTADLIHAILSQHPGFLLS